VSVSHSHRVGPMLRSLVLAAGMLAASGAMAADLPPGAPADATTAAPVAAPSAAPTGSPVTAPVTTAGPARPNAEDPELEKRLQSVTKELRCMVCQNESIADSSAPLAVDMRNEIREQLRSGMTEGQVLEFMVARYGNFVRFRPPLDWTTLALWFGPALLMVFGLGLLVSQLRQRRALAAMRAMPDLSATEQATLAALAAGRAAEDKTDNDKTGNR
jgi:cytochrome c-type biogenesis protein CcmH